MKMNEYITLIDADSFGAECPTNWEEIADYLNEKLTDWAEANPDADQYEARDYADSVWENYWHGDYKDAPEAVVE